MPYLPLFLVSNTPIAVSRYFFEWPANKFVPNKSIANRFVVMYHDNMNAKKKLTQAHGVPVTGDRFWDRDTELALLAEYIEEGAQLSLVAPRRMGKSSLLLETARRLGERFRCLYVDLEKSNSAADAIAELSVATYSSAPLWRKTKSLFSNVLKVVGNRVDSLQLEDLKVTLRGGITAGDWRARGDGLFKILAASKPPVVLLLDEVPILINRLLKGDDYHITPERRGKTDAFLSWLRANTIAHQDRVRVVVTGSIGLEPLLHEAGLSATIAHLTPFPLGPWDRKTARGCLGALAAGYDLRLGLDAADEMLERIGVAVPHYVQMFFNHIYRYSKHNGVREITKETVAAVYENSMLNLRGHAELSQLEERLRMVLGPEREPLALALLSEAAVAGRLVPAASDFLAREYLPEEDRPAAPLREILGILEHDGYLRRELDDSYVFESKLLRDWWKRRFGHTYRSVADRRS